MQRLRRVFSTSILIIAASGAITLSCWPIDYASDCEHIGTCSISLVTDSACIPSKNAGAVSDTCGVFASESLGDDNAGNGTKDKPFKTLATALMRANGKPVYTCAETFAEAVVMSAGRELYGGLDCVQGWVYGGDTARTTIAPPANQVAITLSTGSGAITLENVLARSADAMLPGGASVAVKAEDGSTAELTRCDLVAGTGADGEPGLPGDPIGMAATSGQPGNPGGMACSADTVVGGSQTIIDCGGVMSIGGSGGIGEIANGGNGSNGAPDLGGGQGGTGEPGMGAWSCNAGQGGIGQNGTAGTPGAGASGMGTLTASGYQGTSGAAGTAGTPGQGGGGGGGAKGGMACSGPTKGGASGGSGGSGGCGGLPGGGGGPGGASIGLASFNAKVTLADCTITAGNGGPGGKGGDLQAGGPGGVRGLGGMSVGGLNPSCDGGNGGKGGDGGPGGGGLGGPSFAIAHVGDAPEQRGTVTLTKGMGGPGGLGGTNGIGMNDGAPGIAADVQPF